MSEQNDQTSTPENRPRILVVDDTSSIRTFVNAALRSHGYDVLTAADAWEALRVFDENKGRIDLLLVDMVMPGMNGLMLARELVNRCPNLPVLVMTGYPHDWLEFEVIDKPFGVNELVSRISQALERGRTERTLHA
jgi:DNA-binding response OmpR family regulator